MAEPGAVAWQVAKPTEPVPAGYEWKKTGKATTAIPGGEIITPKWEVVSSRAIVKKPTKVPWGLLLGTAATIGIFVMLRGR